MPMPPISDRDNSMMVLPTSVTAENASEAKPLCADAPEFIPNQCWGPSFGTGFAANVPGAWAVPIVHPGFYPAPMYPMVVNSSPPYRQLPPHWPQSSSQANSADTGGSQCQRRKHSTSTPPEKLQTPTKANKQSKNSENLIANAVASAELTEATPEKGHRCWADVARVPRSVPALPENTTPNTPANDASNVPAVLVELGSRIQNLGIAQDGNVCLDGIEARIQHMVLKIFDAAAASPTSSAGHCAMLFRVCMAKHLCTKEHFRRVAVDEVQDRFQQYLKALAANTTEASKELQGFAKFIGALLVHRVLPTKVSGLCMQALLSVEDQPGAIEALRVFLEELGLHSAKVMNELLDSGVLSLRARDQLLAAIGRGEEQELQAGETSPKDFEQSGKSKTWAEIATASVLKRKAAEEAIQKREKKKAPGPVPNVSVPKDIVWGPARKPESVSASTPSTAVPTPEAVVISPAASAISEKLSSPTSPLVSPRPPSPVEVAKHVEIAKPLELTKRNVQKIQAQLTPKKKSDEVDINALFQDNETAAKGAGPVPSVAVPKEVKWGPKMKSESPAPATSERITALTKKNNSCTGYLAEAWGIWKNLWMSSKDNCMQQETYVPDEEVTSGDSCCGSLNSEEVLPESEETGTFSADDGNCSTPASEDKIEETPEIAEVKIEVTPEFAEVNIEETPETAEVNIEETPEVELNWDVTEESMKKVKGPVPSVVAPKEVKWGPAVKTAVKTSSAPATQQERKVVELVAESAKVTPIVEAKVPAKECTVEADNKDAAEGPIVDEVSAKEPTLHRPKKCSGPVPKEAEPKEIKWGPVKKETAVEKVELPREEKESKEGTKDEDENESASPAKEDQDTVSTEETTDGWVVAKSAKVRQQTTKAQEKPMEVAVPRFAALQQAATEVESEEEAESLETSQEDPSEKMEENPRKDASTINEDVLKLVRRIDEKLVAKAFGSWKLLESQGDTKVPVVAATKEVRWGPRAANSLKPRPASKTPAPWSKPIGMKESVAQAKKEAATEEVVDAWDTEVDAWDTDAIDSTLKAEESTESLCTREAEVNLTNVFSVHFMLKYRSSVGQQTIGDLHYSAVEKTAEEQPKEENSKTDDLPKKTKEELKAERRQEWEAKQQALAGANASEQPKLEVSTSENLDWFSKRTEKIELKHSPHSWASQRHLMRQNTDATCTTIKGILNKLTIEKFERLYVQLVECGISKPEHIECLVKEVFERATTQHHFIEMYTMLCTKFSVWCVDAGLCEKVAGFKKILLNQCQDSFEKYLRQPEGIADLPAEDRIEAHMKYKTRMVGNIKFVGQLLIHKMLSSKILIQCAEELMKINTEETLETLCAFLTTIGPSFDTTDFKLHGPFKQLFTQLKGLAKDRTAVPPRIRCLIQDVVDLQHRNWDSRREVEGPKTMAEVKAEWERDQFGTDVPSKPVDGEWETAAKKGSRRP